MTVSARSYLTAGMATMVVGAVAFAPVQPSAPASITSDTVRLSAAVQPLVNQVSAAATVLGQADAVAAPQQPQPQASAQANNTASNVIDAVYGVARYWANYVSLSLGPWLLGWVPFGYLASDQIYIWYPNFTLPVVDSFVYDFLDPVVNDFRNPAVWLNGLTAITNTARVGLGIVVQQEIAYAWSLSWFPFPLPPLPPLAATKVAASAASSDSADGQKSAPTDSTVTAAPHSARPRVTKQSPDASEGALVVAAATETDKTAQSPGASKSGTGGSAKSGADTGKKRTTAGSPRSGRKAAAAAK